MAVLILVCNITAPNLADLLLRVINLEQSCGFITIVVIRDNPTNAKAFQISCKAGIEQAGLSDRNVSY